MSGYTGRGSSATNVVQFTTTVENTGTALSVASDATNGTVITVNETGLYDVGCSLGSNGSADSEPCISRNASGGDLTAADPISSIADPKRLTWARTTSASGTQAVGSPSRAVLLTAGDVIRVHSPVAILSSAYCMLAITKLST